MMELFKFFFNTRTHFYNYEEQRYFERRMEMQREISKSYNLSAHI